MSTHEHVRSLVSTRAAAHIGSPRETHGHRTKALSICACSRQRGDVFQTKQHCKPPRGCREKLVDVSNSASAHAHLHTRRCTHREPARNTRSSHESSQHMCVVRVRKVMYSKPNSIANPPG